jgi:chaperonin GroES
MNLSESFKALPLDKLQDSENINDLIDEQSSKNIATEIIGWVDADEESRSRWKKKMEDANKLALQVADKKDFPWRNAANVKFPLITIAATQFAARSYPALVKAPDIVKYRVQGSDQGGMKAARANRISNHMSYQLLDEDEKWEEDHDKMLLVLPIVGCAFKKSYYDTQKKHNCSKLVLPKNLVVHYYASSIEDAERKTEIMWMSARTIKEKQLRGLYSDFDLTPNTPQASTDNEVDERQGTTPPADATDASRKIYECHCFIDLDNDGYKEPYVVTVDHSSGRVLRIVSRWKEVVTEQSIKIEQLAKQMRAFAESLPQPVEGQKPSEEQLIMMERAEQTMLAMQDKMQALADEKPKVLEIKPIEYYTKYTFIPSPDGGFYDLGFGALLGPLNNSVNTLINQLIDSGTLQNGSVGFIGKGARIKGGKVRFSPNEWIRVPVAGGTLRDSLVPLPVNPPSPVLFNLLSLMIQYAERVGSVSDVMVGENPGQNTPAYNMSAMLEQGMQIFNGIFKRVYRSMRAEFRKLYNLNAVYLDNEQYFQYHDQDNQALRIDYTGDPKDLIPAADPNAFSNQEKVEKAMLIKQNAQVTPGYDPIEVERKWLEAMDIADAKQLFPLQMNQESGRMEYVFPPQPDPELEIKKADMERRTIEGKVRGEADIARAEADLMVAEADVTLKMAQAAETLDKPELERLKEMLKEMQDKRKSFVELAKLEVQKEIASAKKANDGGTD